MLTYYLSEYRNLPLYEALFDCIRRDILQGTIAEGERLPSKRALAKHLGISITTVEHAYQKLEEEAYVYTRPGCGFFVEKIGSGTGLERPSAPSVVSKSPLPPTIGNYDPLESMLVTRSPMDADTQKAYAVELKENRCSLSLFPSSTWARLVRLILSESTSPNSELYHQVPYNGLRSLREAIAGYLRK